jgi:hypothetical protein
MNEKYVNLLAEGSLDLAVLSRLTVAAGLSVGTLYGGKGKSYIDRRILNYNRAALFTPWIVLRDLDRDAQCASELVGSLLPAPATLMCFRVAVRSVESWLLADNTNLRDFFQIRRGRVQSDADIDHYPKQSMLNLLKQTRSRDLRHALVREDANGQLSEGPEYSSVLSEYVSELWVPNRAKAASDSLSRACNRIAEFALRISAR